MIDLGLSGPFKLFHPRRSGRRYTISMRVSSSMCLVGEEFLRGKRRLNENVGIICDRPVAKCRKYSTFVTNPAQDWCHVRLTLLCNSGSV